MRVTQAQREETHRKIVSSALKLLSKKGFDATTTRDLADAAGIASGTFFNYFETKESLVVSLLAEALARGRASFAGERQPGSSLEEDLFGFIATGLRHLRSHRKYLPKVLEPLLSPLASCERERNAHDLRAEQMQAFASILRDHGFVEADAATLHLCWSLYLSVLSFFCADDSPRQEDTLALLDRTVQVLVVSLNIGARRGGET